MKAMVFLTTLFLGLSAQAAPQTAIFKCVQDSPNYMSQESNIVTVVSSRGYSKIGFQDAFNKSPNARGVITVPTEKIEFLFSQAPEKNLGLVRLRDAAMPANSPGMLVQFSASEYDGFVIQFARESYDFGFRLKNCTK